MTFSINSFRNTIRVSNGLDTDKDRHSVIPALGPNCIQRLTAEDKVASSRHRVNEVVEAKLFTVHKKVSLRFRRNLFYKLTLKFI